MTKVFIYLKLAYFAQTNAGSIEWGSPNVSWAVCGSSSPRAPGPTATSVQEVAAEQLVPYYLANMVRRSLYTLLCIKLKRYRED